MGNAVAIRHAEGDRDICAVRELFNEYQQWLGVDLCFQGFSEELKGLPGAYNAPEGCLLLACDGEQYTGVIGIRRLETESGDNVCEMKRLYVRPPWRGKGIGRVLSESALSWSKDAGYVRICLDTLESLSEARALYVSQGFRQIDSYYHNPLEAPLYMERDL